MMHAYICFSPLYARLWVTVNTYTYRRWVNHGHWSGFKSLALHKITGWKRERKCPICKVRGGLLRISGCIPVLFVVVFIWIWTPPPVFLIFFTPFSFPFLLILFLLLFLVFFVKILTQLKERHVLQLRKIQRNNNPVSSLYKAFNVLQNITSDFTISLIFFIFTGFVRTSLFFSSSRFLQKKQAYNSST